MKEYEFLQDKNFSRTGTDVVKANKGDVLAVPEHLAEVYLENKVIKKVKVKKDSKTITGTGKAKKE